MPLDNELSNRVRRIIEALRDGAPIDRGSPGANVSAMNRAAAVMRDAANLLRDIGQQRLPGCSCRWQDDHSIYAGGYWSYNTECPHHSELAKVALDLKEAHAFEMANLTAPYRAQMVAALLVGRQLNSLHAEESLKLAVEHADLVVSIIATTPVKKEPKAE